MTIKCAECGRVFDMFNDAEMEEWEFGHDCEVPNTTITSI